MVSDSWQLVEDLGFWPRTPLGGALVEDESERAARQRGLDLAAIMKLYTGFSADDYDEPPEYECAPPHCGWDPNDWEDAGDGWGDWDQFEEQGDWSNWWEAQPSGPMGSLDTPLPPQLPRLTRRGCAATEIVCSAPEDFRCCLNGKLCDRPVRTPAGVLYNLEGISAWLIWNKVCPVRGDPLSPAELQEDSETAAAFTRWLVL